MAALNYYWARRIHGVTVTTAAKTFGLSEKVKRVDVTNASAGRAFCTIKVTDTLVANDDVGIVTAVAEALETYVIPTASTRTVYNSRRASFIRGSFVGSTTTFDVEGMTNAAPELR